MVNALSSRENERVKEACHLAGSAAARRAAGLFFAEGTKLCLDLAHSIRPAVAFFTRTLLKNRPELADFALENFVVNDPVADKLSTTRTPQGLWCLFPMPQPPELLPNPAAGLLICEAVQDPANAGALLRTAAALGVGGVALTAGSADVYAPKALRASMGCALHLPVWPDIDLQMALALFGDARPAVYAAALHTSAVALPDLHPRKPWALLVGSEGQGLSEEALAAADTAVYIPMQNGVESLNAAAAGAVLLYHFTHHAE